MLPQLTMIFTPYYLLLSLVVAHLGRKSRIGFWGTFFCSLLLTPVVVLFVIILLSYVRAPRS